MALSASCSGLARASVAPGILGYSDAVLADGDPRVEPEDDAGELNPPPETLILMRMRLVRAIWLGTVLFRMAPDEACPCEGGGRAMTCESGHDVYATV
jgi:hypothetical protein